MSPRRWLPPVVLLVLAGPLFAAWLPGGRAASPRPDGFVQTTEGMQISWPSLAASLAVAAAAASLAVCAGGCLAWLLAASDLPGRHAWASVLVVPFVCPGIVWAMAQVYCYGQGGLAHRWLGGAWPAWPEVLCRGRYAACAFVLAQVLVPVPMLLGMEGVRRLSAAAILAARLIPCRLRRFAWYGGAIRQELAGAWLLCLALGLGNFAIPHVLQCRLYTIEVYMRQTNYLDPAGAAGQAVLLVGPALATAVWLAWLERGREYATLEQLATGPVLVFGRGRYLALAGVAAYTLLVAGLPIGALAAECRSPAHFFSAVREAMVETHTTLWIAGLAGVSGLVLAAAATWGGGWRMCVAASVLLAIPPLVVGMSYARFFNRLWPLDSGVVTASAAPLVLALALRGWPFGVRILAAARGRLAPQWFQAAGLAGLTGWQRMRRVTLPLLATPAVTAGLATYMLAVGEVEITQALAVPGSGTLALRLFTFLHFGPTYVAASLALLLLVLAVAPLAMFWMLWGRELTPIQ
jgi:iron(III) transport system permease protein